MTAKSSSTPDRRSWISRLWALWLIIALVAGYFISTRLIPVPQVGLVRLEGDIYDEMADYVVEQLNYAKNDPAIRAVVLKINSPGGGVTASENLYYSILSFREQKPLIVSIDTLAASGGYYAASAGDVLYAKPSSSIGNIGVVSLLPSPSFVDEELITTGPFKLFGSTRASYIRELEILKQGFLEAVLVQRQDKLAVNKEELARGELYVGILAVDMGLIDKLGTLTDAVEEAAQLARIANYQVVDMSTIPGLEPPEPPLFTFKNEDSPKPESRQDADIKTPQPGLYYRSLSRAEVTL